MGKDAGWDVRCPSRGLHRIIRAGREGGRRARCSDALPRWGTQEGPTGGMWRITQPGTWGEERGGMQSSRVGRNGMLSSRGGRARMLSCRGLGRAGRGAAPRGSLAGGNLIFMKCSCLNPKSSAPVTRSCVTLRSHGNCCYFQDPSLAEWHKSSFPFSCPFFPAVFSLVGRCFRGGFCWPLGRLGAGRRARSDAGAAALSPGGRSRSAAPAREPLHESGTGPAPPK